MKNCIADKALEVGMEECGCRPSFFVDEHTDNYETCVGHGLYCIKVRRNPPSSTFSWI